MSMIARSKEEAAAIVMHQRRTATAAQVAGIKADITALKTATAAQVAGIKADITALKTATETLIEKYEIAALNIVALLVVDDTSGDPITGAEVTLITTAKSILIETDSTGAAVFTGIPDGTHTIKVAATGYTEIDDGTVTLSENDAVQIIEMTEDAE